MPIAVRIDNQNYTIPFFDELTIGHLLSLRKCKTESEILVWGLGGIFNAKYTEKSEKETMGALILITNLVKDIQQWMLSSQAIRTPEKVTLDGLDIQIKPDMINSLPYWGTVRCRQIMYQVSKIEPLDYTDYIPEIISHYIYSIVTKSKYNEVKADEFIEIVEGMNMVEAIQLGNFFLLKQIKSYQRKKDYWHLKLMLMRSRLALMFSRNSGNSITWRH